MHQYLRKRVTEQYDNDDGWASTTNDDFSYSNIFDESDGDGDISSSRALFGYLWLESRAINGRHGFHLVEEI